MKILYVINQLHCGGAEQQLVTLCEGLRSRGHQLEVISIYDKLDLRPRLDAIQVPVSVAYKYSKIDLTVVWRLRDLIKKCSPELIHAYLPASCLFTGMTKWTGVTVPIIQSERSVNSWRPRYRVWLDSFVRRRIAAITCNADAIERRLIDFESVPATKTTLIYNGLAPDRRHRPSKEVIESARQQILAPAQSFIVIAVANFVEEKQHHVLLKAFEKARKYAGNLFLVLVGRGELEPEVCNSIQRLGLAESTQIIRDCLNPLALLCASDAAILTSSVEGCSNALLEAMAAGLPIVVTNAGGNSELVIDGLGGIVCPIGDVDSLTDGILQLWRNKSLRHRMGKYNLEKIRRDFTDDVMVERTLALYERVLNDPGLRN